VDDLGHQDRIQGFGPVRLVFKNREEPGLGDESMFDDLDESDPDFPRRERFQDKGIAQDEFGLMKSPDDILVAVQIDAGFAADTRVHLSQKRSRDKSMTESPQIGGRDETGDIANDAAADSHDESGPVDPQFEQIPVNRSDRIQRFTGFTPIDENQGQRGERSAMEPMDVSIRDQNGRI